MGSFNYDLYHLEIVQVNHSFWRCLSISGTSSNDRDLMIVPISPFAHFYLACFTMINEFRKLLKVRTVKSHRRIVWPVIQYKAKSSYLYMSCFREFPSLNLPMIYPISQKTNIWYILKCVILILLWIIRKNDPAFSIYCDTMLVFFLFIYFSFSFSPTYDASLTWTEWEFARDIIFKTYNLLSPVFIW